jgi:NAD(P)-dependent dehydrogenase (short-subunit alcohol dehydrogenase family)
MREFAGKAAFVTGGSSGIGLALGRAFAEAGCKVMLTDIEKAALDTAAASLSGSGREIRWESAKINWLPKCAAPDRLAELPLRGRSGSQVCVRLASRR